MSKPVPAGNPSLMQQIVMEEIKGKNSAIHAYDKIIWTRRRGR